MHAPRTCTFLFSLVPALLNVATAQNVPPMPAYPPQGCVLVDDMWVPRHVLTEDGHWDGPKWTNGTVPYAFDAATVSPAQEDAMRLAMAELEAVCGVDFVPWTNSTSYVLVRENPANTNVSNSQIGMQPLGQILNVGSQHWNARYVLVHELMHALGYVHEHQRPDRNAYVTIHWGAIHPWQCGGSSCNGNFTLFNGQVLGPYDFASVMHYGAGAFGIGSSDTITCKPAFAAFQNVMGQRSYLSYRDVMGLQTKYGLPAGPSISGHFPQSITAGVGNVDVIVTGAGFFVGSTEPYAGTQGSRLQYLRSGVWQNCESTVVQRGTKLVGTIDVDESFPAGPLLLRVSNDPIAGGASNTVQVTVAPVPCASAGERLGHAMLGLGDVDFDGLDELVVSRPGYQGGRGQVLVMSGSDGSQLWQRGGTVVDGEFGFALARVEDVDGDLVPDLLVGEPGNGTGRVHVLSGSSGAVLRVVQATSFGSGPRFGEAVAAAGDLNLDGVADFVVGSPEHSGARGRVDLVSGSSGGLFFAFTGLQAGERLGTSVAGGFDLDGDGRPEVVAGAPRYDGSNGTDCGRIAIYEGAFGSVLAGAVGDGPGDRLGASVALAPSTDGSAVGCVAAGAPENGTNPATVGTGFVRTYRYANGPLVGLVTTATRSGAVHGAKFGTRVLAAGDVDDDGGTDFLIAAPGAPLVDGIVELVSGRSGDVLWRTRRQPSSDDFGHALGVATRSSDGTRSALIGSPRSDGNCVDSGSWSSSTMRVRPAFARVMMTEIHTAVPGALPAAVEITNFAAQAVDLSGWRVRFRDLFPLGSNGSGQSSSLAGVVLRPRESIVLRTPLGGAFSETPPSVRTLPVLSSGPSLGEDFVVGLIAPNGYVVDELRVADANGTYVEGSLGGKFGAPLRDDRAGPFSSARRLERIWGLDSNDQTDWTAGGPRTMGLESGSGGARDWRRVLVDRRAVVVNEVARGAGHYVELRNRGDAPVGLQGWALRFTTPHGAGIEEVLPFPESVGLAPGELLVVGSTAQPPPELPANVRYVRTNGLQLGVHEFALGLYDSRGRLVDLLRATRAASTLAHNEPRLPAHPRDFRDAARVVSSSQSLVRNQASEDHDVGDDWRSFAIRSMGSTNPPTWSPDREPGLDVRVNRRPGVSLALLLDAAPERAGHAWSFAVSAGHHFGQGPVLGLGADAIANWITLSSTAPFHGVLDARGDARLDLDGALLPPGLALDFVFVLMDPANGAIATWTPVLSYDS